jgi:ABC-2 type transport system ATP-binding protein
MLWFCGGHGICLKPYGKDQSAAMNGYTLFMLNQYVAGVGSQADSIPSGPQQLRRNPIGSSTTRAAQPRLGSSRGENPSSVASVGRGKLQNPG